MLLHEVIWPNKYLLISVGLWPIRSGTGLVRRLFTYFRFVTGTVAMICLLVPNFMTVVVNWGDIKILGDHGALTVFYFLLTLKILYYMLRQRSFRCIYQHIKDFWNISDDPKERTQYERLANNAKIATIVSFLMGLGNVLSFEAVPLISLMGNRREINESLHHRPLPMELYYGFDTQRTPTYEMIFTLQTICMISTCTSIISCDCTMMVFILHVAGQFKLISSRFRAIGRKISEQDDDTIHAEINKCIARHQHTIKVTEELNALVSPLIFGQIMTSGMEICLSGYAVIECENSGFELVKFLIFFVSMLAQLFIWCLPAELLIQESTAVAETVYYDVPWFKLTPSQQRDLGLVTMRAQKECHVTAFFQVISIKKLTDIFNAAGSYMALLRSMKK